MSLYVSTLTAGTNSHQETSENVNAAATDFVSAGVIGAITNTSGVAPSTGAFAVNAQGSPNMTVAVSSGIAWAACTPTSQGSQMVRIKNTASANVTISANASGSTVYDWLYISLSATNAANPASDASNVATLVTSRSSSSTVDNGTPPSYGYNVAVITVANAASSITNGNIADTRVLASMGKRASGLPVIATVATAETTTSTSYTDLATTSDTVTAVMGNTGMAIVTISGDVFESANGAQTFIDFACSGANTRSASDSTAFTFGLPTVGGGMRLHASISTLISGFVPGSTVFKMKYKVSGGTGTFQNRSIVVEPK